ncbi:MAG TPA: glycosyltransferase family 4 protein [Patescibacteria group bacterium]|nr:glycosyltransferase family 4 protein [Patescibacteria group bacterium]
MRVGITSPYLDTLAGGERYLLTVAECLSREHRVDIFWDDPLLREKANKRLAIDLFRTTIVPNIFSGNTQLFNKLSRTRKYDVIFFLSDGSIPFSFARRNVLHFQRPFPSVAGKTFMNRIKLSRFQAVICNSKFTKRWIDRRYGTDALVVYPPVDIDQFISPDKSAQHNIEKEKLILSVGRFHPFKKHEVMIEAFIQLQQKIHGWRLCIAGGLMEENRQYFGRLENMARNTTITLLKNESADNLKMLYKKASLYWHAAGYGEDPKIYPEAMEHFGITTVESMAAGCIPLVYAGGGQKEIVRDNRDGYLWKTTDELIQRTEHIINNDKIAKNMRAAVRERSKLFSRERFCDEIIQLVSNSTEH